jgi:hypothetical protein
MATTTVNLGLSLDGLSNVDTTGKANGNILVWNSTSNKWEDATPTSGGTPAGTSGQVQFNDSGAFGADSAFHWDNTNKRLGVGATPDSSVRLDVRAQGSLSTDIAFRVRNSANTANLFEITGQGKIITLINGNTDSMAINGTASNYGCAIGWGTNAGFASVAVGNGCDAGGMNGVAVGAGVDVSEAGNSGIGFGYNITNGSSNAYSFGRNIAGNRVGIAIGKDISFSGDGNRTHFIGFGLTDTSNLFESKVVDTFGLGSYGTTGNKPGLTFRSGNLNQLLVGYYSTDANYSSANGTNWLGLKNGTAPDGAVDAFQMYSSDIVAGNAAPHFRTENGSIIKLYQQSSAGITTVADLVTVLTNLGLLA